MSISLVNLIPVDKNGRPSSLLDHSLFSALSNQYSIQTAAHYQKVGFNPPWIGYLSVYENHYVGGGAFVAAPMNRRVEIAYYTLPEFEGKGIATATAQALLDIAERTNNGLTVIAKTLPQINASTRILSKLEFCHTGLTIDDEVGEAWLWERKFA